MARFPLSSAQISIVTAIGFVLWFLLALLLGYIGPLGAYEGWARVALYAAIVPGTYPLILLTRKLANLSPPQVGLGVSVAVAAAILCDGVALAWFPGLYGGEVFLVAGAGAAILWGGGVAIVLGMLVTRTE